MPPLCFWLLILAWFPRYPPYQEALTAAGFGWAQGRREGSQGGLGGAPGGLWHWDGRGLTALFPVSPRSLASLAGPRAAHQAAELLRQHLQPQQHHQPLQHRQQQGRRRQEEEEEELGGLGRPVAGGGGVGSRWQGLAGLSPVEPAPLGPSWFPLSPGDSAAEERAATLDISVLCCLGPGVPQLPWEFSSPCPARLLPCGVSHLPPFSPRRRWQHGVRAWGSANTRPGSPELDV